MSLYQTTILDCTAANFHFTTVQGLHVHCSLAFVDLHPWWFVYMENECIHRLRERKNTGFISVERAHDVVTEALSNYFKK